MSPDADARSDGSGAVRRKDGDGIDNIEAQFSMLYESYRIRVKRRAAAIDPALQPAGYRTLLTLVDRGPIGASALAERLGFDKSVISRQLRQLEELGLVTRDRDADDGRAIVVRATPSAVSRVEALNRSNRDEFRTRLSAWSEADLGELGRLLAKLDHA